MRALLVSLYLSLLILLSGCVGPAMDYGSYFYFYHRMCW
jgi:hypothetical protein